jgi:UPF0716 protein FxsA
VVLLIACLFFVAEAFAFVAVGENIGFGWAVLLLIGVSALGPLLVRRVGLGVLARTQDRLAQGEVPTRELLDGVVVLAGGVLICLPGFISDAFGLLLMIGPVRSVLIRMSGRRMARRVETMRSTRWTIIDAPTMPASAGRPPPRDPTPPMLEREQRSNGAAP